MSQKFTLRSVPDVLVKCYTCNGSGMNPNGVTMFEPCPTCNGWGQLLPPKEEQHDPNRKRHQK